MFFFCHLKNIQIKKNKKKNKQASKQTKTADTYIAFASSDAYCTAKPGSHFQDDLINELIFCSTLGLMTGTLDMAIFTHVCTPTAHACLKPGMLFSAAD